MAEKDAGLESLTVWQKAVDFAVMVCRQVADTLPEKEKYALAAQLRRSAQSVPANIAEGYGRYYYQETIRFCYIARGSLEETFSHLTLANRLGYLPGEEFSRISRQVQDLQRLINGYIAYLKRSKRGEQEPGARAVHDEAFPYIPPDPDP